MKKNMNKEDKSYYPAETYRIEETRTTNVCRTILIPYGYPKNYDLLEAKRGDIAVFKDGRTAEIEAVAVINIGTPIFEVFCSMIYGLSTASIVQEWHKKYKNDIQYESAIVIIYDNFTRLPGTTDN